MIAADPASYRRLLVTLAPGDVLELAPGVYPEGLPLHDRHGVPGAPITITGVAGAARPVFLARDGAATVSLMDSSHLVVRRLELDGRHRAADGVKAEGQGARRCVAVHDIVLEDLHIHDHDANQQTVGINSKCTAWRWTVRDTVIERVGTGVYLGGSAGDTPFLRGTIEYNRIAHTIGYNLQIKHQVAWPDLPGFPGGAGATVIRHNVFSKAGGGATGPAARPNVLVGHWPANGPGSVERYEIHGNLFHDNPTAEPLLQAEGRVAVYSNLFVNPRGDAMWIQPHHDRLRDVRVFWNTVLAAGDGVRIARSDPAALQLVVANAVFTRGRPLRGGSQRANVTARYERAGEYLQHPFAPLEVLDLRPRADQLTGHPLDVSELQGISPWDRDFDGCPRQATSRGAFEGPGCKRGVAGPGWRG